MKEIIESTIVKNNPLKGLMEIALRKENYSGFLTYFDNTEKLQAFFLIKDKLTKEQAIELFKDAWTTAEINHMLIDKCKQVFKEYGMALMNNKEQTIYNNLPSTLTVYRGTRVPTNIDEGISWTTSKKVAETFMNSVRGKVMEARLGRTAPFEYHLREKQINKYEIRCFLDSRNEQEIIIWEE